DAGVRGPLPLALDLVLDAAAGAVLVEPPDPTAADADRRGGAVGRDPDAPLHLPAPAGRRALRTPRVRSENGRGSAGHGDARPGGAPAPRRAADRALRAPGGVLRAASAGHEPPAGPGRRPDRVLSVILGLPPPHP